MERPLAMKSVIEKGGGETARKTIHRGIEGRGGKFDAPRRPLDLRYGSRSFNPCRCVRWGISFFKARWKLNFQRVSWDSTRAQKRKEERNRKREMGELERRTEKEWEREIDRIRTKEIARDDRNPVGRKSVARCGLTSPECYYSSSSSYRPDPATRESNKREREIGGRNSRGKNRFGHPVESLWVCTRAAVTAAAEAASQNDVK